MRKRFISGLTALCIVGILITNMITSASASLTAAVVGASVAGSLLLGSLFNQMCGGQGYDFTNAFQDAVKLYTDWDEDFDGSAKDPIHPVTKVEIDTSKVNIQCLNVAIAVGSFLCAIAVFAVVKYYH